MSRDRGCITRHIHILQQESGKRQVVHIGEYETTIQDARPQPTAFYSKMDRPVGPEGPARRAVNGYIFGIRSSLDMDIPVIGRGTSSKPWRCGSCAAEKIHRSLDRIRTGLVPRS